MSSPEPAHHVRGTNGGLGRLPALVARRTSGALQGLLDNQPFAVDLAGEGGGATFTVKGQVAEPKAARGIALDVSASGDSLADMTALTGAEMPPLGPYNVSAKLSDIEGGYQVEALQARMGGSDISGSAGIAMGGERPKVTAALTSTKLDLKDFGVQPAPEGAQPSAGGASGSDGRVDTEDRQRRRPAELRPISVAALRPGV